MRVAIWLEDKPGKPKNAAYSVESVMPLNENTRKHFNLPDNLEDGDVWNYCYLYSLANDFSGHIALFNTLYSFHRGLWVASSFVFLVSSFVIIMKVVINILLMQFTIYIDWRLVIFAFSFFVIAQIFDKRKKRFYNYTGEKILITFDILSKDLLDENK